MKINATTPDKSIFLQRLAHIAKAPKSLYYIGTLPQAPKPVVSIIGSRRPTAYGRDITTRFARELAEQGAIVMSGMAIGVDALAHTACLDAGGTTIAVIPSSLDILYPRSNRALAERILAQGGAIISEYPPGTSAMQYRCLQRNRLVSGLSDAVVVTEANIRSGSLSTVSYALEQGRDVYAVPGNITSPLSAGCNHLIRQGAAPLLDTSQLLEGLGISQHIHQRSLMGDNKDETAILRLIVRGVSDGEQLQTMLELSPELFARHLTMMEIKGHIVALGGNQWRVA